jgi:hypothetical protein
MSIYVKAINTFVEQYPYSLGDMLADNPTVSFAQPISLETAADFNTYLVEEIPQPTYDPITQNLIWTNPDFVGGVWVQTWAIEPATQAEIEQRELQAKAQNKSRAQTALSETDWVDIPAVTNPDNIPHLENKSEFDDYRLILRGIAVTPPVTVDSWPVKPEELWVTE